MTVALAGAVAAVAAALAGLSLVVLYLSGRRAPRALQVGHPIAGVVALVLTVIAAFAWQGPRDLPFDAGGVVLALVFLGGGLLFALRLNRLPQPSFVVVVHGAAAVLACALLLIGLAHARVAV